jgi:hypothetical protein
VAPDRTQVPGVDWQATLRRLESRGTLECEYNDSDLEGLVVRSGGDRSLSLAVDRPTTPRQRNTTRPERAEMRTLGTEWEPVEETFVRFFPNNIVGLVRSTNSAPTHAALARWLNTHARPAGHGQHATWFAQPIVDEDRYRAIRELGEVTWSSFAVKPATVAARRGMLGGMFDEYLDYSEGLRVEIKVSAGRGRAAEANKERMLHMAQEATELYEEGVPFERAIVRGRPQGGGALEEINLLEHKLTAKFEIPVGEANGSRSLSEQVVFGEIQRGYVEMSEQLQDAIGLN